MKIQKHYAHTYKGKKYYKYVVVIPNKIIKKLNLNLKKELDFSIRENKITLRGVIN